MLKFSSAANLKPDYIDEKKFLEFANKQPVVTDKVKPHKYQQMYGLFILPLLHQAKRTNSTIKLLEIGLGCDMTYGPGNNHVTYT